jgi:ASC-1-like (ASCH) protein
MATYDALIHPLVFAHLEAGRKTVHIVPRSGPVADASAGDRLEFPELGTLTIGVVRRYPSVEEALEKEGFTNVVPDAGSLPEALATLRRSEEWSEAVAHHAGVIALRVRSVRRKVV